MPKRLNSLDMDSYVEKCFLLFDFFYIFFHLYRIPIFCPIQHDFITSVFPIQYNGYIPHIYIYIMPLFISFFSYNLEYSNGQFFFFVLVFTFPNENRGMFHYDLDWAFLFLSFFLFLSIFFLSNL